MKNKTTVICLLLALRFLAQTDFRFDSVVYRTLYPKDLCTFLAEHPKAILIDVRSPGEFSDTSAYSYLNIGHLKGARNISIDSIGRMIPQLRVHAKDPVILYCSHSQRSRRVSKMLTDSGFTEVRNLNGGMTWMRQASESEFPCKKEMLLSGLPYKGISAGEAVDLIRSRKDLLIVDVRSSTEFEGRDTTEAYNIGRISNAVNIPARTMKEHLPELGKQKKGAVLLYDLYGSESAECAELLLKEGFTQVYTLLGGIQAIIARSWEAEEIKKELLVATPSYKIVNVKETVNLLSQKEIVVLDVRPTEEYLNQSKQTWRNLGRIKNAIHIEPEDLQGKKDELSRYKASPILVYGSRNAAKYCKMLADGGFSNVHLLYGGLWDMVYVSTNVPGFKYIKTSFLENNEGLY